MCSVFFFVTFQYPSEKRLVNVKFRIIKYLGRRFIRIPGEKHVEYKCSYIIRRIKDLRCMYKM